MKTKHTLKKIKKLLFFIFFIFCITIPNIKVNANITEPCSSNSDCPVCERCPSGLWWCTDATDEHPDSRCAGKCSNGQCLVSTCIGECKDTCSTGQYQGDPSTDGECFVSGKKCCVGSEMPQTQSTCPYTCQERGSCDGVTLPNFSCTNFEDVCCNPSSNIGSDDSEMPPSITNTDTIAPPNLEDNTKATFGGVFTNMRTECMVEGNCSVEDMVAVAINITNILLATIASIALLFFIVSGIQLIISQGDQQKISSAKAIMLNSVIGLVIAMCSFLIVGFIQKNILNLEAKNVVNQQRITPNLGYSCEEAYPGYSCKECGDACSKCKPGYCSGGATNLCCPPEDKK